MAICVDIVPTPCGGTNKLTMKDACNDVHFTGIEDTTINQGVGIDLTEGIHAYDGNGNEIEYTVTPDSIDKCDVGEHTVVYRTIGEGDKFLPSFCMDNVDVTLGDTFCNEILLEEDRIVTITQADPPTIEGIETIPTIYPNEEFDPTEGITATDDNGKTIDFTYSGRVEDSSEGAIASFETEFEQNALLVVADIEPVQSFNGYDKPWVGGAGVNILDPNIKFPSGNQFGLTVTTDGYTYSWSGTATASGNFQTNLIASADAIILPAGTYRTSNGTASLYKADGTWLRNQYAGTFTVDEPFFIKNFYWEIVSGQTYNVTNKFISLTKGETLTEWRPYENICPISGHDEVNVYATGKNVLLLPSWSEIQNAPKTGSYKNIILKVKPNTVYYLSTEYESGYTPPWTFVLVARDTSNGNWKSIIHGTGGIINGAITSDSEGRLYLNIYDNLTQAQWEGILSNVRSQLEEGSVQTAYEPFGDTYTTDLERTVYGGYVDIVRGELVVTHKLVTLNGDSTYYYQANGTTEYTSLVFINFTDKKFGVSNGISDTFVFGSNYTVGTFGGRVGNGGVEFRLPPSVPNTSGSLKAWFVDNPAQFCYELAEPQRYPLTPQEVELLLGENNVWADTGDIKVIYEKEMPASGNIEYLTAGFKIITYTATDECGNQTVEQRIVYVLGDTPQVCMAEVCTAHTACVVSRICSSEICTAQCS